MESKACIHNRILGAKQHCWAASHSTIDQDPQGIGVVNDKKCCGERKRGNRKMCRCFRGKQISFFNMCKNVIERAVGWPRHKTYRFRRGPLRQRGQRVPVPAPQHRDHQTVGGTAA